MDALNSNDSENLRLLRRPELGVTLTKIHVFNLTEYSKCVYLDADTLVLQNVDDLFERCVRALIANVYRAEMLTSLPPQTSVGLIASTLACSSSSRLMLLFPLLLATPTPYAALMVRPE